MLPNMSKSDELISSERDVFQGTRQEQRRPSASLRMDSLVDLITQYDSSKDRRNDTAFLSNLLKELRKSKINRPDIVVNSARKVLKYESGNEVWNLQEQLVVAALSCGDNATAEEYLAKLVKKFPDSIRVRRLEGMLKESLGQLDEAFELYAKLLMENPSNILLMKRRVGVLKAKGNTEVAITALNSILKQYPAEASSWLELGEIYLSICSYEDAAHCFEELVLLDPQSAAYQCRLAEVYFSIGGLANFLNARKHYAMSLNLQAARFNLRSAYGLVAVCQAVDNEQGKGSGNSHEAKVNAELLRWAKSQLSDLAEASNGDSVLSLVNSAL